MSVILTQFPDPVMKKHKTPPYTQQDYNAVNYMNGTISVSSSANTAYALDPVMNTNYCFHNDGGGAGRIFLSPDNVNLAGTKIHFNKASASMHVQWVGDVRMLDRSVFPYSTRTYMPTGYQVEFYWGSVNPNTQQILFTNNVPSTSVTSDSIIYSSINLNHLINGQDEFRLFANARSLWIYVNGTMTRANNERILSNVTMTVSNITCNFNIDYVILSTGDKIYKGQTI